MSELLNGPWLMLAGGGVISTYLYGFLQRTFFERREWTYRLPYVYALVYVIDFVFMMGANFLEFPPANFLSMVLGYFIPLYLCYKVNNFRGIAYYIFYVIGMMVIELVFAAVLGILTPKMGFNTRYDLLTPEMIAVMNLLEIVIVFAICRFGSKDKNPMFDRITLLFMLMPFLSIIIILSDAVMLATGYVEDFNVNQFARLMILIFMFNIATFIILERYTSLMKREVLLSEEKRRVESEADIMEIAAKSLRDRLDIAEKITQQDRVMRHDRRHFEAMLLSLLKEDKEKEAIKCLEERLAIEPRMSRRYCDNTTVNAAIGYYISLAENEKIRVTISTNIPQELSVDEMEFAITVSNLLENAINACMKLPKDERYIKFIAKYKSQLLLEVENPCDGSIELDEDGYPFTNIKDHGVGTRSVIAFVNKTHSNISYSVNDNIVRVRMII